LGRADRSSEESYRLRKKDYETEEDARAQLRTVEPLMNQISLAIISTLRRTLTKTEVTTSGTIPQSHMEQEQTNLLINIEVTAILNQLALSTYTSI
jgi:hypothetical protein